MCNIKIGLSIEKNSADELNCIKLPFFDCMVTYDKRSVFASCCY